MTVCVIYGVRPVDDRFEEYYLLFENMFDDNRIIMEIFDKSSRLLEKDITDDAEDIYRTLVDPQRTLSMHKPYGLIWVGETRVYAIEFGCKHSIAVDTYQITFTSELIKGDTLCKEPTITFICSEERKEYLMQVLRGE